MGRETAHVEHTNQCAVGTVYDFNTWPAQFPLRVLEMNHLVRSSGYTVVEHRLS